MKKEKEYQIKRKYINVTRELIEQEGYDNVNIRKIADKMNNNSATLYKYFDNLEVLLIYSSINFLKDYIKELIQALKDINNSIERYLKVYEIFAIHSFNNPQIYYNLFYGPQSNKTEEIIKKYYMLFSEELMFQDSYEIASMLREGDVIKRDRFLTMPFLEQGILTEKQVEYLIQSGVRIHHSYLDELINKNKRKPIDDYIENFYDILETNLTNLIALSEKT